MPNASQKTVVEEDEALQLESELRAIARAKAAVREFIGADRLLSEELIAERRVEVRREFEGA